MVAKITTGIINGEYLEWGKHKTICGANLDLFKRIASELVKCETMQEKATLK